jgi:hypothetical protein
VTHMPFVRRLLTFAVALPLIAVGGVLVAPAANASPSDVCPSESSTRVLTADGGAERLWIYAAGSDTTICFKAGSLGGGRITVHGAVIPNLVPTAGVDPAYASCPNLFTVEDPVQFVVAVAAQTTNPYSICFGVQNGQAVKLTLTDATKQWYEVASIYLDAAGTLGAAWCEVLRIAGDHNIDAGYSYCLSGADGVPVLFV